MTIAVAYTEYQLIQIQALVNYYQLENVNLITFKKNRIPDWLIDSELYEEMLLLPPVPSSRYERITKSFINRYYSHLNTFIRGRKVNLMIGAQDENTIYNLIKYLSTPESYWSIEDGLANYYERKISFKTGILLKRLLFKNLYGYNLDISYGHGKVSTDKSFRMFPKLSIGKGEHYELKNILAPYLNQKCESLTLKIQEILNKYKGKKELIVTNFNNLSSNEYLNMNNGQLYKFHPNDTVPKELDIDYINDVIPIEIFIMNLKGLTKIRFDAASTSIANLLCLNDDLAIEINFNYRNKNWSGFMEKLFALYPDRLTIT